MDDPHLQGPEHELELAPHVPPMAEVATLDRLIASAKTLAHAARSPATKRAYQSDLLLFRDWCAVHGLTAVPATPQTVALYAAALLEQGRAVATIRRRMIAIGVAHKQQQLPVPTEHEMVRDVLKGIRRTAGVEQVKKEPLRGEDLKVMLAAMPATLRGLRDRAILLLGYTAALRRSELASLRIEWIKSVTGGLEILLPTSKTDQDGAGTRIVVEMGQDAETCPVRALKLYTEAAKIKSGAIFRGIDRYGSISPYTLTGRSIALIVQQHVSDTLQRDASQYGAHSLRAGFATVLDEQGVGLTQIMQRGRWKSERVARGYIRSDAWRTVIGEKLGL